jgi:hypothetical protein
VISAKEYYVAVIIVAVAFILAVHFILWIVYRAYHSLVNNAGNSVHESTGNHNGMIDNTQTTPTIIVGGPGDCDGEGLPVILAGEERATCIAKPAPLPGLMHPVSKDVKQTESIMSNSP